MLFYGFSLLRLFQSPGESCLPTSPRRSTDLDLTQGQKLLRNRVPCADFLAGDKLLVPRTGVFLDGGRGGRRGSPKGEGLLYEGHPLSRSFYTEENVFTSPLLGNF